MLDDEVAKEMNWKGKYGKLAFEKTKTSELISGKRRFIMHMINSRSVDYSIIARIKIKCSELQLQLKYSLGQETGVEMTRLSRPSLRNG